MTVHMIDVGQGLAVLVEFSCGAVLIDTGGESNAEFESTPHLLDYLDGFFKRRADLHGTLAVLLLTHPHIDHTRNAMEVFKRYTVLDVVTNGVTTSSGGRQEEALIAAADEAKIGDDKIRERQIPHEGEHDSVIDPLSCADGDPDIRVFWGAVDAGSSGSETVIRNNNNDSVVAKLSLGKSSVIITGDLEEEGIASLLAKFRGTSVLDADVYVVGHHGSYNATTKPLLDAITPKVALIGVGSVDRRETWSAWAYGHPRRSTIELLEAALSGERREPVREPVGLDKRQFEEREITAPIYATGWDGNIQVQMFGDGRLHVQTATSKQAARER